jgi:cellulose synthase (UDP-forming)
VSHLAACRDSNPVESIARHTGILQKTAVLGLLTAVLLLAAVHLSAENQLLFAVGTLALLHLAGRVRSAHPDWSRTLVTMIGAFITLRYWLFRTTETLGYTGIWDFTFLLLLYLAETYGILVHFMGMFVNLSPLRRRTAPLPPDPRDWPTVDVFIPTYDEDVEIVEVTASACTQLDYPEQKLKIYILDDGGTTQKLNDPDPDRARGARLRAERLKTIAARLGVTYLTRPANHRAKAGNINDGLLGCGCETSALDAHDKAASVNHGFHRSGGDLILILDCDHVPTRDLLRSTVGFFLRDEKLFLVQTPHFFINPTPVEKNLQTHRRSPSENEMFYGAVHPGMDFWNASFFCGSAAVLRRKYLLESGGIASDTVTEDAETALALHNRGYNSVYLNKPMVMGLSPESFEDFILQRSRWAQGMTQILMLKNPLRQKGLSLAQRICYFNSCLFWLFGLARIVFFVSPLLFLFFGMRVYNASFSQIATFALPHLVASYYVTNYLFGRLRHPFFSELYETIQSIFLAPAVLSVFRNPHQPTFQVTPKALARRNDSLTPLSVPFYLMCLLSVAGYVAGGLRWAADPLIRETLLVCSAWNTFNLLLTLCCLGVVWERRQLRRSHRYATHEPAAIRRPGSPERLAAILTDLSTTGVGLTTDGSMEIPDGRLIIEARDSGGRPYALPARVIRQDTGPTGMSLGCEFVPPDEIARKQVVSFVYGDSNRWKYFHESGIGRAVGSFKGFLNLLSIGVKGSLRNLRGIARILLDFLIGLVLKFRQTTLVGSRRERLDEMPEEAPDVLRGGGAVSGSGRSGHSANPHEKAGAGSGSPTQGIDGQLQLHHPHPGTLESHQDHSALQLR